MISAWENNMAFFKKNPRENPKDGIAQLNIMWHLIWTNKALQNESHMALFPRKP